MPARGPADVGKETISKWGAQDRDWLEVSDAQEGGRKRETFS
jgi:hypothetical protein